MSILLLPCQRKGCLIKKRIQRYCSKKANTKINKKSDMKKYFFFHMKKTVHYIPLKSHMQFAFLYNFSLI